MTSEESFEHMAAAFYKHFKLLPPGKAGCARDENGNLTTPTLLLWQGWTAAIEYMKSLEKPQEINMVDAMVHQMETGHTTRDNNHGWFCLHCDAKPLGDKGGR